ncbi:MAG: hypothetical protein MET45_30315 [Nostoc sp. LLA-1]|nr:hypothetical protein [Cyanocohniella sp. LLY]MCG6138839.1 hypothetical protein [Cyanocohniella sp. LLY]
MGTQPGNGLALNQNYQAGRLASEAVFVAWLLCLLLGNAQMPLGLSNKYGYAKLE